MKEDIASWLMESLARLPADERAAVERLLLQKLQAEESAGGKQPSPAATPDPLNRGIDALRKAAEERPDSREKIEPEKRRPLPEKGA